MTGVILGALSLTFVAAVEPAIANEASASVMEAQGRLAASATVERSRLTGLARFVRMTPGRQLAAATSARTPEERARSFFATHGRAFGLATPSDLRLAGAVQRDRLGMDHARFRQTHRGLPVTGAEVIAHLRDGSITAVNGRTLDDSELSSIDLAPALDAAQAGEIARGVVEAQGAAVTSVSEPRLELFNGGLFDGKEAPTRLAWFVVVGAAQILEYVWVDAQTSEILLHFNQHPDARYRSVYDAAHDWQLSGTLVRSEGAPATGDADTDAAYEFAGDTYDYFLNQHGRDSVDGSGQPLVLSVHYGIGYRNAGWYPSLEQVAFGDGVALADDVVAHELTHGLTQHTADLYYYKQSGALNESFSDIFGEAVDLVNGAGTDTPAVRWLCAEDWPGVGPIRDMMSPSAFGDPGKVSDSRVVCSDSDNGGVHSNSGILNHAFALMVDGGDYNGQVVRGIGLEKAGKVMYRALTLYLTATADLRDAHSALLQSCSELVDGDVLGAPDCVEVQSALNAVETDHPWPCDPLVSVSKAGNGTGTVTSTPSGIDCGETCEASFSANETVELASTPDSGSVFAGWRGACSGSGACSLTVSSAELVTATFDLAGTTHLVSVSVTGSGSVVATPSGIDCGGDCSEAYPSGASVTLTAIAPAGWTLDRWGGDCAGRDVCVLTIDSTKNVMATFLPAHTVSVTSTGVGRGTVVSSPAGIKCSNCDAAFAEGTVVTLTAQPGSNSAFSGWSGACTGLGSCVLTMDGDKAVSAAFYVPTYNLSVSVSGSGSVSSSPAGIDCGSDCSEVYPSGTDVTLTATPASGHTFGSWAGACSGSATTCVVSMAGARSVTAVFDASVVGTLISAPARKDAVYDSFRDVVYLTEGALVRRYHVASGTFLPPYELDGTLGGIDLSPDGRWLAVARTGVVAIWLIDLENDAVRQVAFAAGAYEDGTFTVSFARDGQLLVSSHDSAPLRRYDPMTGEVALTASVQGAMLAATGDGAVVAFADSGTSGGRWGRYRVADGDFAGREGNDGTAAFNYEIGVNRDATQYAIPTYYGTYIYDREYVKIRTIGQDAGPQPIGVAYHPVENVVYFPWSDTTEVRGYDTTTFSEIARYNVGYTFSSPGNHAFQWGRTRLSRDGSLLMVTVDGGVRIVRLYDPLTANSQDVATAADTPLAITLSASIGNGGALAYRIVTAPAHGHVEGTGQLVTYVPEAGYVGNDMFQFVATYGLAKTLPQTVAVGVGVPAAPHLIVAKQGLGVGMVTSTPAGIECGATCSAGFPSGTTATLTPTPEPGSYFTGWAGACSGFAACSVTMDGHKTVTAKFDTSPFGYRLSVATVGLGAVRSSPAGILCGTNCGGGFDPGTTVTLTAVPGSGYTFQSWGGACSGSATTCAVTMSAARSVTASFAGPVAGTLIAAPNRKDAVYDSFRDVVYVTDGDLVRRYRVASGAFLAPFELSGPLMGIDLSPDGRWLAVATGGSLSIWLVDLRNETSRQVTFTPGTLESATHAVSFAGDDQLLVSSTVTPGWAAAVPLRRYDLASGEVAVLASIDGEMMLSATGDGTAVAFGGGGGNGPWGRYRLADGELVQRESPYGTGPYYEIGANSDGTQYAIPAYGGARIYDRDYLHIRTLGTSGSPRPIGVAYQPVENVVYFPCVDSRLVRAYDTTTFREIGQYDVGFTFTNPGNDAFQSGRTRLSRDGSLLMVTVSGGVRIVRLYDPLTAVGQDVTTPTDTPVAITLNASIGNGGALGYRIVTAPLRGHLEGAGPTVTYVPDAGFAGNDAFEFVATYGLAETAPRTVALGVGAPVAPRLSVSRVGAGEGTVTSTPAGIDCGATCSASYLSGTSVTLTPTPEAGSYFVGWSGACSGLDVCSVAMDGHKAVVAQFGTAPLRHRLAVATAGLGIVSSSPAGILCGMDCSEDFAPGATVTLTAVPGSGYTLQSWSGDCSGSATTCTLTMDAARSVTATFAGPAVGTLIAAANRKDAVYDSFRDVVYITDGSLLRRYRVASGVFLTPFELSGALMGIDLSPDGRWLAIATSGSLSIWLVDLTNETSRQVLFAPAAHELSTYAVSFASNGELLISSSPRSGFGALVPLRRYDPATGATTVIASVNGDTALSAAGDGTTIAFAEGVTSYGPWGRYRVADGDLLRPASSQTGYTNYEIGANHDATQYAIPTYHGTYLYDRDCVWTRTVGTSEGPRPISAVYHPVEDVVYFPWVQTTQVKAYDATSHREIGQYNFGYTFGGLGQGTYQGGHTRLSRDGSLLMVAVDGGFRILRLYAPLTASGQNVTTTADTPVAITLAASVGNDGALGYRIVLAPAHGRLEGSGAQLSYVPDAGYVGSDAFQFVATYGLAETLPQLVAIGVGVPVQPRLTVSKQGLGAGTVASIPTGIDCGTACDASFPPGTIVMLTPTPEPGSYFVGWSGACSGLAGCSVTMDGHKAVSARFETAPLRYRLSVATVGLGVVSSSPAGVLCGTDCSGDFEPGASVTLTAAAGSGYGFQSWGGACSGSATTCTVTMDAACSVTATFTGPVVGTLIAAANREDAVYDGFRDVVYVTDGNFVRRHHVASGTLLTPFELSGPLMGIDLSPDGRWLAAATTGSVSVWLVDLANETASQVSFTPEGSESGTHRVAFSADGQLLISSAVPSGGSGTLPLRKYGPATGAVTAVATVSQSTMLAASGDGTIVAFSEGDWGSWGRYRVTDGDLVRRQGYDNGTDTANYEIAANRDATQYFIRTFNGTYIYNGDYFKTRTIGGYPGPGPVGVAYHPVESVVYAPWAGSSLLKAYDATTFSEIGQYDIGYTFAAPWSETLGRTRISRDGSLLMVTVDGGVRILRLYAPLTANGRGLSTPIDTAVPVTLSASIGNGGALSYRIVAAPGHGHLEGSGPLLTYVPEAGFVGNDAFQFVATYGLAETLPQTVAIGVGTTVEQVLTVSRYGQGAGTLTSTPAGIDCGTTCSASYPTGTLVTLTPTPGPGSIFAGWSGACSGLGPCSVTMDAYGAATATFALVPLPYRLSVATAGLGVVSSSPAGVLCGADCSEDFAPGATVTLTAAAGLGWALKEWSGDCSGLGTCTLLMDGPKSVTATFVNVPGPLFAKAASLAGMTQGGAEWGDYDNDGDLDLALVGMPQQAVTTLTKVYRNDGGVLVDSGASLLGVHRVVRWGDYDRDGDLDLLVGGWSAAPTQGHFVQLYRNDAGTFIPVSVGLPTNLTGVVDAAWGDFDGDGDLDLALTGFDAGSAGFVSIHRNDAGTFVDAAVGLPGGGFVAWGDYDRDGDLDLLVGGNDLATRVYRNDDGLFVDAAPGLLGLQYGSAAWVDYDGDGDLDVLVSGLVSATGKMTTKLYRNDAGAFLEVAVPLSGAPRAPVWMDFDADGDLDVLILGQGTTGFYRNDAGGFTEIPSGLPSFGAGGSGAPGDLNNDGRPDVLVLGYRDQPTSAVYVNTGVAANTRPSAPASLASTITDDGVRLEWSSASDLETPAVALTYNVRVGTTAGGCDVVSGMADPNTGFRRIVAAGNAGTNTSYRLRGLTPGRYYWAVQAIDTGFAGSPFVGGEFVVPVPEVALTISDVRVAEGNSGTTAATFTVKLLAPATQEVTVEYATADGSAVAPEDYEAQTGVLVFSAGQMSRTITVSVRGDTDVESDEVFVVSLSNPVGAPLQRAQGTGAILNDDTPTPTPTPTPSPTPTPTPTPTPGDVTTEEVVWTAASGVTVSDNDLTKTASSTWGNAGAVSSRSISAGDGYVELVASETDTGRVVGLSNGDTNTSFSDVDFGVYLYAGAVLRVYENGFSRGIFGTYATGDVIRVSVTANVVRYSRNGAVFYTSTQTPTYPLLVDAALLTNGATIKGVVISGVLQGEPVGPAPGSTPTPTPGDVTTEEVVWTAASGVTVSDNDLTKTASSTWGNAGAVSSRSISAGDGYVELVASETDTGRVVGLSNGDTNTSFSDVDFGVYLYAGAVLRVYENGFSRGIFGTYATGDVIRVSVTGNVVRYSRNGVVFYASTRTPTYPLLVDAALLTNGATIKGVVISGVLQGEPVGPAPALEEAMIE